jgi:hypothetical protein
MLSTLSSQGTIEWSKLVLCHFDIELIPAAQRAAAFHNASQPSVVTTYLFLPLIDPEKLSADPSISNCRIRRLGGDDAEIIDAAWRYRSEGSLRMIRSMIGPFHKLCVLALGVIAPFRSSLDRFCRRRPRRSETAFDCTDGTDS